MRLILPDDITIDVHVSTPLEICVFLNTHGLFGPDLNGPAPMYFECNHARIRTLWDRCNEEQRVRRIAGKYIRRLNRQYPGAYVRNV